MNKIVIAPWLPALLLAAIPAFAADTCNDAAGRLESAEGSVAVAGSDSNWQPLAIGDCIPVGSQVKVSTGRAVFRLANETLLRTAGETQLRFSAPTQKRWIHLIDGLLHLITRTPRDLEVESEYVNAGVKGTEFIVASDRGNATGQVIVLEGEVIASNDRGNQAVTGGNAIIARAGEAPQLITVPALRDAVQWTLHYPPLPLSSQPRFNSVTTELQRNNLQAAAAQLDAIPEADRDADYLTLRAAVDLQRGATAQARASLQQSLSKKPDDHHALALQAVADIATGNTDRAADLLARIDNHGNDDTTVLIARSYLQQARFDLPAALDSAEKAAALDDDDALIQARTAELALMNGKTRRADTAIQRSLQLQPMLARAHALDGFLKLQRLDLDDAEQAFTKATQLDSSDPLPRLGLGLIEIRHNQLEAGREQLELAVALDPGQSLSRSYLGKAYQLEQRDKLASDQYSLARQFDSADPTPWLYSALLAQSQNRPFEALQMVEESIERNDNRAVYRSRLQLEGDEATRTASQADIYRDLGFKQLAQRSAAHAVTTSPGSYGGHRQLAEIYADDPQYDAARASEVLQAQLLQPLSATPIQPLLAETNLLVTDGAGPGALGYRNYDALFVRERPNFQVAGLGGSNDTGAGQVSVSGVEDRLAYAVDYYHYETQGYRENNDARYDVGSAYAGFQANETLSLMLSMSRRDEDRGEITEQLFNDIRPYLEVKNRIDTVTLGGRLAITPSFYLLTSVTRRERELQENQDQQTSFGELSNIIDLSDNSDQLQMQALLDLVTGSFLAGIDWSETEQNGSTLVTTTDPFLADQIPLDPILYKGVDRYQSGYGYWSSNPTELFQVTLGVSYAKFDSDKFAQTMDGWHQKVAATYQPHPQFSLRATYFESIKRPSLVEQSLEPTQLGEFNQVIDDREGTESSQYGVGADLDLLGGHHIGFEWLERKPDIPLTTAIGNTIVGTEQTQAQLFWSWSINPVALNLSYRYDHSENTENLAEDTNFSLSNVPSLLTTHRIPLELSWAPSNGMTVSATVTYFDQKAERPLVDVTFDGAGIPTLQTVIDEDGDNFTLVDLSAKYRFWKHRVEISVRCNNITDESFRYQNTNLYDTTPQLSPYIPERTFLAGIKLAL